MSIFEIVKLAFYIIVSPFCCYFSLIVLGRMYEERGWGSDFASQLLLMKKGWGYFVAFFGIAIIIHSIAEGAAWDAFSCALLSAWFLFFYEKVIDRVCNKLALAT
jgi:hypothetical protein